MPKFEYRFDIAAVVLASALSALGITAAQAGGKGGVTGGDVRSRDGIAAASAKQKSPDRNGGFQALGGKGGISGGDVRSRALEAEAGRVQPQVYAFPENGTKGCYPDGTLLRDAAGALYATTYACGPANSGTVVRLKPPGPGQTRWTSSLLYAFRDGNDGSTPNAGLVMDASGALYGTTTYGGRNLQGVVYKLTPSSGGRWTHTTLYDFRYDFAYDVRDGASPGAGLFMDKTGALYGTTMKGGNPNSTGAGYGTVFKLTPPQPGQTRWTEAVLYRFSGGSDGWNPLSVLIADSTGALYGTTLYGGIGSCRDNWGFVAGCGTAFKLTPPPAGNGAWTKTTLHRFRGGSDGGQPQGRLLLGARSTLYGTTFLGGRSRCANGTPSTVVGCGTVFKLAPPAAGDAWTKSIIHEFMGRDGAFPQGGVIAGAGGALYGTASSGGADYGVVYKLSPPLGGRTKWTPTVLQQFDVRTSGYTPVGELAIDPAGRLFGVTFWGGPGRVGTAFAIAP